MRSPFFPPNSRLLSASQEPRPSGSTPPDVGVEPGSLLTAEHRDSWTPSWNSNSSYSVPSGNYDFLIA